MPLDTKSTNPAYLMGRLCAMVYPDSVADIPPTTVAAIFRSPMAGLALLRPRLDNSPDVEEIIEALDPGAEGPLKGEAQGPYWLGYYHQRATAALASRLAVEDLRRIGEVLYGPRWQTEMAQALRFGDSARIRQFLSGARPIPAGIYADTMALLRHKSETAKALADELERRSAPDEA
ncbi:hypothetical protein V5G24_23550 [Xanthobacter sp. VTT E-85241]|uniref:hypothetical protein n=1 Tax=Roseixanthobacter finlandensis TaxID=3119922 RepID=UPI003728A315